MKFYFITSIFFSVFLALMAINESYFLRMIFLILVLLLFFSTLFLFAYEYDKQNMKAWSKKEERLKNQIYIKFFKKYFNENTNEKNETIKNIKN